MLNIPEPAHALNCGLLKLAKASKLTLKLWFYMAAEYQVLARRYRPKKFKDVIGQEPIVKTLKNALTHNRLAHAYLFCGSRGTGKTTLARIFAKALNCENIGADFEPCNACSSCLEIAAGTSFDVLEIDGASHRGIDDIRLITESVGFAPARGRFKIYLIDEVHMLTKEAFNALLKTLEEPPSQVKFFFATTEPHKLPETILSRCQRFNLKRISLSFIVQKLRYIAGDLSIEAEDEALLRIAENATGGLRDAESLFDQIIAFSDGKITAEMVHEVLGVMSRKWFFQLDEAFVKSDLACGLEIAQEVFLQGKDIPHFLEDLATHYRHILLLQLAQTKVFEAFDSSYLEALQRSAQIYSQEQCMTILDLILQAEGSIKAVISHEIALEALLLRILRERHRLPIEYITRRLSELEKMFSATPVEPSIKPEPIAKHSQQENSPQDPRLEILPSLEKKVKVEKKPLVIQQTVVTPEIVAETAGPTSPQSDLHKKSRYDTLIQLACVELEASVQKNR